MLLRKAPSPTTDLNYILTTTPTPLQITPADTTATPAAIAITAASPNSDPVHITSIKITLAEGTGAGDLTEHLDQIHATVTPADDWTFTRGEGTTFVAVPAGDRDYVEVSTKGILFELTNIAVNGEIGVTTVSLLEKTEDDGDGKVDFYVGKCFPSFQFSELRPTFLDDGRTSVQGGESVTLTWNASHGASYTMLYDNAEYDVTNVRTWTTPAPLFRDTSLHLRATLTTDGHDVTHYLHTSVTVDLPNLIVNTLDVIGTLTAESDVNAVGDGYVRIKELRGPYNKALNVNSSVEVLSGNDVTVANQLTVNGTLNANSDVNAVGSGYVRIKELRGPYSTPLNVNSSVEVLSGNHVTITDGLTVNGSATVSGTLTAESDVQAVGDGYVRIKELRGPYGVPLKINSKVEVLSGCDVTIAGHLDVDKDIKRDGQGVVCHGDGIGLRNQQKDGWLFASEYTFINDDRGYVFRWNPGNRVGGDEWIVSRDSTG